MAYETVSKERAEGIREGYRVYKDKSHINWYIATKIAQEVFGKKGFARIEVRSTSYDVVDPDGYVIPLGSIWGFTVGYTRKGKRGAQLSTKWTSEVSYRRAFQELLAEYRRKNAKLVEKMEKIFYIWGIL